MKVRYTELAGASGSRGGSVAARNRGGNYFRVRATPTNPNTFAQQAVRNVLASLSTSWRDVLSDEQRENWLAYADTLSLTDPLGQPIKLTGLNAYVRGNALRRQAGLTAIANAPTLTGSATFTPDIPGIVATPTRVTVGFGAGDSWATAQNGAILAYLSDPVSPARNYPVPTRLAGFFVRGVGAPANPIDVEYTTDVAPVEGQRRFVRLATVDAQGRISQDLIVPVTITAD